MSSGTERAPTAEEAHDILMLRSVGAMAIAEGDEGWQRIKLDCPMLVAVAKLRRDYDALAAPPSAQARDVMTDWRNGENMAVQNLARPFDDLADVTAPSVAATMRANAAQAREALEAAILTPYTNDGLAEALANSLEENAHVLCRGDDAMCDMMTSAATLLRSLSANVGGGGGGGGAVASQWRDIATAPRDGTWFIGADMAGPNKVDPFPCARDDNLWAVPVDFHIHFGAQPTHWQPLPAAPGADSADSADSAPVSA